MENILSSVEKTINKPDDEYTEKDRLFEILHKDDECGIKIINVKGDILKIPKGNKSLERLTYILKKWYRQQFNGGGITEYVFGEENGNHSYSEKITHIH
jgi:hypothetical protein